MLQKIKEHIGGFFAWIIVGLITISFVFWGIQYYFRFSKNTDLVAKVGKISVRREDLAGERQIFANLFQVVFASTGKGIGEKEQDAFLIKMLLSQLSALQSYSSLGLVANNETLAEMLVNMKVFQDKGKFLLAKYKKFERSLSSEAKKALNLAQKIQIMFNQLQTGIQGSAFSGLRNSARIWLMEHQKRTIRYKVFKIESVLSGISDPSEAELRRFYQSNLNLFKSKREISFTYFIVSTKDMTAKELNAPFSGASLFYRGNSSLRAQFGNKSFNEIKDKTKIFQEYLKSLRDRELAQRHRTVNELIHQNPTNIEEVGKGFGEKIKETPLFNTSNADEVIGPLFKLDKKGLQTLAVFSANSPKKYISISQLNDQEFVVYRIGKNLDPQTNSFADSRSRVKEILKNQLAQKKVLLLAEAELKKPKTSVDFPEKQEIKRSDKFISDGFVKEIFVTPPDDRSARLWVSDDKNQVVIYYLASVAEESLPKRSELIKYQNDLARVIGSSGTELISNKFSNNIKVKIFLK